MDTCKDWLSVAANVAQILALVPLAALGCRALNKWKVERALDSVVEELRNAPRNPASPTRVKCELRTRRGAAALLGAQLGLLKARWDGDVLSVRLATLQDPER